MILQERNLVKLIEPEKVELIDLKLPGVSNPRVVAGQQQIQYEAVHRIRVTKRFSHYEIPTGSRSDIILYSHSHNHNSTEKIKKNSLINQIR
jgi:hypothetical protein